MNYSLGIATNKDCWLYNSSKKNLTKNIQKMVEYYNEQKDLFHQSKTNKSSKDFVKYDTTKITNRYVLKDLENNITYSKSPEKNIISMYRPFFKQNFCYEKKFIQRTYQQLTIFPTPDTQNLVICVSGIGVTKDFSCIISNILPDLELIGKSQCFPLYYYAEQSKNDLFSQELEKRDGISNWALAEAKRLYGSSKKITKENIFYYVYGFLHSKDYRETFKDDLKKSLPKIIFVSKYEDFSAFERAGRTLAELHLNYEKSSDEAEK